MKANIFSYEFMPNKPTFLALTPSSVGSGLKEVALTPIVSLLFKDGKMIIIMGKEAGY